ncbi:hypothetical protein HZS_450 [Henneguya salminicola]|nr:hypothetical protein HZS_450 [Henneguya salminicola]
MEDIHEIKPEETTVDLHQIEATNVKNEDERNKFVVLSKKIPDKFKIGFVLIVMVVYHLLLSAFPVILRKYGLKNQIDIYLLCVFRNTFPALLFCITAWFVEGKIKKIPPLKDYMILLFFGLIEHGLLPFSSYYLSINYGASFTLIYEQILTLGVSIGSYLFKLEHLPKINSLGSNLLLLGTITAMSSSIIVISLDFTNKTIATDMKNPWLVPIILICINFFLYSLVQNYRRSCK